jgi:hypothetical protein
MSWFESDFEPAFFGGQGNGIETNEHKGDFKSGSGHADRHGCFSSQSFWKRGSFRSGSNMGSSRSSAGLIQANTRKRSSLGAASVAVGYR